MSKANPMDAMMQISHCVPVKRLPDPLVAGEFIRAIYGIGPLARQALYTCPYQIQITPFNRPDPACFSPFQTASNLPGPSGFKPFKTDNVPLPHSESGP